MMAEKLAKNECKDISLTMSAGSSFGTLLRTIVLVHQVAQTWECGASSAVSAIQCNPIWSIWISWYPSSSIESG